jgi:tRNA modification GTPase
VLRTVRDPIDDTAIDRGLSVWFPAGGSATGEDLVELHLHGGRAVVDAVERLLASQHGVRRARAGEFTWRAFHNGKLDLVEVESLSDLLRAETEGQRRAAIAGEGLSREVERWRRDVLLLSALVEAQLDQSDEDDVPPDRAQIEALAVKVRSEIAARLAQPGTERLFDGVRVVFAGTPNAGKSSLINALAKRDVAITSPVAGTTRDVIEAPVRLGGTAFVLTDTAGLRGEAADVVEREGIARAVRRMDEADIVVWMDDGAPPAGIADKSVRILARCDAGERRGIASEFLRVSAVTREGLDALVQLLIERAGRLLPIEGQVALSRRQRLHLADCSAAIESFEREADELLAAERLRAARQALDELTGRAGTEEMLDALFGTFCIGK